MNQHMRSVAATAWAVAVVLAAAGVTDVVAKEKKASKSAEKTSEVKKSEPGFIGIYIELKTPGVGLGGVVAAVAFLLFFWSKYLDGTAESLEILMFIAGLVLLMVEAFVIPGVGIFGLTGALLVVFSLVLASQTFVVPHSQAEIDELAKSIAVLLTAMAGLVALAFAIRRYLPKAPVFNRMVLEPPPPEEDS